jgi:type I restriction enzyme M protein
MCPASRLRTPTERAVRQCVASGSHRGGQESWQVDSVAIPGGEGRGGSKTEILFLERCLDLLKPGGRLAIVLPNGNLNGASLSWLRRWAEGKAFLRGVVALPMETFRFSGASVSASVVFMQKFTDADVARWEAVWAEADATLSPEFAQRRAEKAALYAADVIDGGDDELKQILTDLRPRW